MKRNSGLGTSGWFGSDITDTETLYPGTNHPMVYAIKNPDDSA